MSQPKAPIPTLYKGITFRSRTEARYAVFFDTLGVKWEWEKEGYALPSGWYLPDFWIEDWQLWIEIKGREFEEVEIDKCGQLALATAASVVMLWGNPAIRDYEWFRFDPRAVDAFLEPHRLPVDPVSYLAAVEAANNERFQQGRVEQRRSA